MMTPDKTVAQDPLHDANANFELQKLLKLNFTYTLLGSLLAAGLMLGFRQTQPEFLVLALGPTFIAPQVLRLCLKRFASEFPGLKLMTQLQGPAAIAFLPALLMRKSTLGLILGLPWLLLTVVMACFALLHLYQRGGFWPVDKERARYWAVDFSFLFLPVGSSWAVLWIAGVRPMEFPDIIVFLTGVHFHYAGLAMTALAGLAALRLKNDSSLFVAAAVVCGIPAVAIGITFGPTVELLMAPIMVVGGIGIGCIQLKLAKVFEQTMARVLIVVSGLALFLTMLLALMYGMRAMLGEHFTMEQMIYYHGLPNAFAFAVPGVLAWNCELEIGPSVAE